MEERHIFDVTRGALRLRIEAYIIIASRLKADPQGPKGRSLNVSAL
jgi:hypothetical protein